MKSKFFNVIIVKLDCHNQAGIRFRVNYEHVTFTVRIVIDLSNV